MRNFTEQFAKTRYLCLICLLTLFTFTNANAAPDSKGNDFWIAFPGNYDENATLTLFITGDQATTGMVTIPGLGFSTAYSITPGSITSVELPTSAQLQTSDAIEDLGIHVTANDEVTVYGLNRRDASTDAFLALPTDILGTEYINLGYENVNVVNATQLGIVGTVDGTTVTITPSVETDGHAANVPYTITLDEGQTYLLRNTGSAPNDLSGTVITSTQPIAVFGGHRCANIPAGEFACDYIVEQLPATSAWGRQFVTIPLATRLNGDTFRFLASTDNTQVQVNGVVVATLDRGELHEQIIDGAAEITASQPILVSQYSNSSSYDDVTSDPFMMLIPPFEQFLGGYTVATPASGFARNFINVVVPNAAVGVVTLDGIPIPTESFTPIGSTGFSGAQLSVGLGTHNLNGINYPIGAFMYGFDEFDSYGYPGGQSLSPIATVNEVSIVLEPGTTAPVGSEYCTVATATDAFGNPVAGVRVDFSVSGANTASGFATTNDEGEASFCYTGTNAGIDVITATSGALSDEAQLEFVETSKQNQTITFEPIPDRTLGDGPFMVNATASSGLPVTFTIVSGPATVSGNTITPTGVGTVVVEASQGGNDEYNPAPPVQQSFEVQSSSIATGGILWEYLMNAPAWADVPSDGGMVPEFVPSGSRILPSFATPRNVGQRYFSRARGYVVAPVSGEYVFMLAGDDHAELWLSTDEDPANKAMIAHVYSHTAQFQYDKYASQTSAPVYLEAGQRYYIEALHREYRGVDHLSVGWMMPGGTMEQVVSGQYLRPYEPGGIVWEYLMNPPAWGDVPTEGGMIPEFEPSGSRLLTSFATPRNVGQRYFSRARGYVVAPVSGEYVFMLAGDDHAELWLSTDEDPANKAMIAHVYSHTAQFQYDKYASQTSAPVYLEAGQRYYIEALHREYRGVDHLSVGWMMPGGTMEQAIPGQYLRLYVPGMEMLDGLSSESGLIVNSPKAAERIEAVEDPLLAYPNPFIRDLTVEFSLEQAEEQVVVEVFTLHGKRLETLHNGKAEAGVKYSYTFNGDSHATGVYLCRMMYQGKSVVKRIVLAK